MPHLRLHWLIYILILAILAHKVGVLSLCHCLSVQWKGMAFQNGDFVQKVADPAMRGHVFMMDGEMVAVTVGDIQVTALATDWEEVPNDALEVIWKLEVFLSQRVSQRKKQLLFFFLCPTMYEKNREKEIQSG